MDEVPLTQAQRKRLVGLIAERGEVLTPIGRTNLLENAGLLEVAGQLSYELDAEGFSQQLVRVLQARGRIEETDQPALVSLLRELRERVRGHRDEAAFLDGLLTPYRRAGGAPEVGIGDEAVAQPAITPEQQRQLDIMLDWQRSPAERAEPGRRLAEIGDPRPGVGLRRDGLPDIAWCEVPAVEFVMGSDRDDDDAMPERKVTLRAFRIGKYTITYAQYKAFLEAPDGYRNTEWWEKPPKLAEREGKPGDQNWKLANHPAEMVSWYDAMAFCRWLTARLRAVGELDASVEIRLPAEEEWEKAARGTDARDYPWGEEEHVSGYANIDEETCEVGSHSLKRTTTVGIYPQGASPCGALDMSGNVWEWTLTEFGSKANNDVSNSESRVVRGGSWSSATLFLVRTAYRDWFTPDLRLSHLGFRVVVPAPIS